MKDDEKTKTQLIEELSILKKKIKKLENSEATHKQAEEEIRDTLEYAENIVETVREPLVVLDFALMILSANRSFYDTFKVTPGETIGKFIYDLGNGQWDIPKLRILLEEILPHDLIFNNYEVEHDFINIGHKVILLNARQIFRKNIGSHIILLAMEDITEHKRLENLLTDSEERFRRLFETANDGIVLLEKREGKITHTNPAVENMLGYTKVESLGKKLQEIGVLLDMGNFPTTMQVLNRDGIINYDDVPIETKSGQRIQTDIYLVDRASLVQCNIRDITSRKLAENDILEQRDLSQKYLQIAGVMICVLNSAGEITLINRKGLEILGYKDEQELLGKNWFTACVPENVAVEVKELFSKIMSGNMRQVEYCENPVLTKNGEERLVAFHNAVLRDKNNKISGIIFSGDDVTERKKTEDALRESEKRYRELINFLPVPIFEIDIAGSIISFNHAARGVFGYNEDDHKEGINAQQFFIPEEWPRVLENMERVTQGTSIPGQEFTFLRKDGSTFSGLIYATPDFQLNKAVGIKGAIIDISERKQAEAEHIFMEKKLFQAQKLEAIGTLTGGISHDFNNILAGIIGYTELALDGRRKEKHQQYLQEALKGAERAKNLVKQILTFSRQDDHDKKTLDIKSLLKEAVKFLRASIPSTIEIQQNLTDESCNIMADPTQMHQVIMNLCTNATHSMKRTGGTLKIELRTIELDAAEISRYPDLQPGPYVQIAVSDTGQGIDPVHIQRIFDPFFTTKSKEEGTGLGLSVVYGIVKSHGGIINVYSEPDKGAVFNVYLPRIIHSETIKVDTDKPVAGGKERILFVDDEPALVDLGTNILSSLGYEVTGVTSSLDALELFRAEPQRFDLVITDMTLPKMTGIDLSRKIQQIRPDIPIVLCSGIREASTEEDVQALGIKSYLIKPLTRKELARVVRKTLDGKEQAEG